MSGNNVLSQADIDALLNGSTPPVMAGAEPDAGAPHRGGSASGEGAALGDRVAALEGVLARLEQMDVLVARVERLEKALLAMRQSHAEELRKFQSQVATHLKSLTQMVRQGRPSAGTAARPPAGPSARRAAPPPARTGSPRPTVGRPSPMRPANGPGPRAPARR